MLRDAVGVVPYEPAQSLKYNDTRGKTVRPCHVNIPYSPMFVGAIHESPAEDVPPQKNSLGFHQGSKKRLFLFLLQRNGNAYCCTNHRRAACNDAPREGLFNGGLVLCG